MLGMMISAIRAAQQEYRAFEELCDSVSPDEAQKLRDKREARRQRENQHRMAIEIAKAGRSRNFWGKY